MAGNKVDEYWQLKARYEAAQAVVPLSAMTEVDGRYYGRGTADNKGQHSINMAALACVLAERGRLGFNAKFMLETGEELSSPGLRGFCG